MNCFLLDSNTRRGQIFPTEPAQEIPEDAPLRESPFLFKIYNQISCRYLMGDYSLKDFTVFRRTLGLIDIREFNRIYELISLFLDFDRSTAEFVIRELAKNFGFPLFEQRVAKKVMNEETGKKEKTIYVIEEKPFAIDDILRFAKALDGKVRAFSVSILSYHPEFYETEDERQKLTILEKIFNEGLNEKEEEGKPIGQDVFLLYDQFDQQFSSMLPLEFHPYLEKRREELISFQKSFLELQINNYRQRFDVYYRHLHDVCTLKKLEKK